MKGVDLWKYGEIELAFLDGVLTSIYSSCFSKPTLSFDNEKPHVLNRCRPLHGGEKLNVITWIFSDPSNLTLGKALDVFMSERMDFFVQTEIYNNDEHSINLTLKSGVSLHFGGDCKLPANQCVISGLSFKGLIDKQN